MPSPNTRKTVYAAVFAALICVMVMLNVPIAIGGGHAIVHVGDALIFLAAVLLPLPYAMAAAAVGAGLANYLLGIVHFMPFTMVIKPLMVLCFTNKGAKIFSRKRNFIAPLLAGVVNVAGYYIAYIFLLTDGDALAALSIVPFDLVQFAGSIAIFILLGKMMDRHNMKEWLFR